MTIFITCEVLAHGHHIQTWTDFCPESPYCSGLQSEVSRTLCHRDIPGQTHSHQVLHCHQHRASGKSLQLSYLLTQPSNQPKYISNVLMSNCGIQLVSLWLRAVFISFCSVLSRHFKQFTDDLSHLRQFDCS